MELIERDREDGQDTHPIYIEILSGVLEIIAQSGRPPENNMTGLRSPSLGDQLATVASTASLVEAHPFPMYVNMIVVRLADAFKDGSNPLRMTIARVLSECRSHLSLVFSGSEIFKRFLSVSHSNDPVARAMTLQVLASLAPISPESKQVHHLIVESMSAEDAGEFQAACHAMAEFAHLSSELGNLGQSDCMQMRIRYLQISCNCLCRVPNERKWQMLCGPFLATIEHELPTKLAIRLYRTLGQFLCCSDVAAEQVLLVLDSILRTPVAHTNISQLIEFCCQITSHLPFVVGKLHHWARGVVEKESHLLRPSLAYLLLAPSVQLSEDIDTLMNGTDLDRYVIARVAFRNGQWKRAALPNLQAICTDRLSLENCEWIQALRELAASQLSEFSVSALFEQNKHLYRVHAILKSLAQSSQHEAAFAFPSEWVACLLYSSDAALQIASAVSPTLNWCKHPLSAAVVFRVKRALEACEYGIGRACQAWLRLARSSFGADEESIDFLALQHTQCALVQYAVQCVTGRQASAVPLPTSSGNSTHTQLLLEQLQMASSQIAQLAANDEGISIQMSVSIHSQIKDNITISTTDTVPIQVDGVISTTHTVPVHSVIITASLQFPTMSALNYNETRTVKPTQNIHFTANFLMQFKQTCNMEFSVEFVDGEQGKRWVSDTTASLKVDVKE
ncbi:unnamed protein product [Heligmosomoides polygyrus]|uniref:Integrator complex subunit 7 n=1 Tax=Heligmosomoides polygyrus TaxID=6339 RepID=A0A3P7Y2D9_HELPZ|nr:unnamed protein product [Heligmosomoides polygyrus]